MAFLSRTLYNENDVRIYSMINTYGYGDLPNQNPAFIDMGIIRVTLYIKFKNAIFKIVPSNKSRVDRFFNTVNDWFRDPNMVDLFVYNEFDKLIFNQKYASLKKIVYSGGDSHQFMEAIPVVLENTSGKDVEGVVLSIDNHENSITLTVDELDTICGIIEDFSFQNEILFGYFRYLRLPPESKKTYQKPTTYNNPFIK